jgi:pimeloyl-ACP methyl ester carboxylesterase
MLYVTLFLCAACMKLDNNLYNVSEKIDGYKLDAYAGDQDFVLDDSYNLSSQMVNQFTIDSKNTAGAAVSIHALYIGDINKITTDTVILYCHGNRWHMDFYWQRAKLLSHVNGKNRYGVMMMDYQGYGLSGGEPSEENMYNDVKTCLMWLKEKGMDEKRLVFYGFSLGSAPVCELTANPDILKPDKIILEAPFASVAVMVQDASQLNMPAEYFTDLKIDNAEEIKKVGQPLLWIHGDNDNFLNFKTHGEVVFKNHTGTYKEKFIVHGADHGEVPERAGFEKYLELLGAYIRHN